jgi:crotonobetainyl-CoA:carnitine CoA-transferase CaiB-like acyl-CoA transferase
MTALSDIRLLEFSDGWTATTLAGRLLAELGAQVVKIEPPAGDTLRRREPRTPEGVSYAFELASAGKDSVIVPVDQQVPMLENLLAASDVCLIEAEQWQSLMPRELSPEKLVRRFPHLVLCLITPRGLQEPDHNQPWSELVLQASTGLMATTGFADDPPMRSGVSAIAHGTAILAAVAVLAALHERRRSGLGQIIDLAGYDVGLSFLGTFLPRYFRYGTSPQRIGNRHPLVVPWDTYPARDGWVIICSMGDSSWLRLLEVLGRADLKTEAKYATAQARYDWAKDIDAMIAAWTRQRSVETIVEVLNEAGVAAGPILPVPQYLAQAYCQERRLLVEVPHAAAGKVPTLGPLFKMSATPGRVERCAPTLGQGDLDALLAEAFSQSLEHRSRSRMEPVERPLPGQGEGRGEGRPPVGSPPHPALSPQLKPLEGVRVVEMGAYTAVPYGTRLLALLGAEVIKVEPQQGDPLRRLAIPLHEGHRDAYGFHLYNTGKKSVTLAPETPRGRELLLRLIKTSQVFVHNLSYDLIERLGLSYDNLRQAHPGLVYCTVSGFGQEGAWRQRRAFDTILQAFGGIMDLTGRPERPPVKVGISVVDLFGALFATAAILAALRHADRSGEGQSIDVALGDVAAWLTCETWPLSLADQSVSRLGNRHWFAAPHNVYQARDGEIVLAVQHDTQWQALLRLMGGQELCQDERYATLAARLRAVEDVDRLVQAWVAGLHSAEVIERCQEVGIAAASVQEVGEAVEHPLAAAREVIVRRGPYRFLGAPFRLSRTPAVLEEVAPELGQHNQEVYQGLLGLRPAAMEELKAQGVI